MLFSEPAYCLISVPWPRCPWCPKFPSLRMTPWFGWLTSAGSSPTPSPSSYSRWTWSSCAGSSLHSSPWWPSTLQPASWSRSWLSSWSLAWSSTGRLSVTSMTSHPKSMKTSSGCGTTWTRWMDKVKEEKGWRWPSPSLDGLIPLHPLHPHRGDPLHILEMLYTTFDIVNTWENFCASGHD